MPASNLGLAVPGVGHVLQGQPAPPGALGHTVCARVMRCAVGKSSPHCYCPCALQPSRNGPKGSWGGPSVCPLLPFLESDFSRAETQERSQQGIAGGEKP